MLDVIYHLDTGVGVYCYDVSKIRESVCEASQNSRVQCGVVQITH